MCTLSEQDPTRAFRVSLAHSFQDFEKHVPTGFPYPAQHVKGGMVPFEANSIDCRHQRDLLGEIIGHLGEELPLVVMPTAKTTELYDRRAQGLAGGYGIEKRPGCAQVVI